MIDEDEQRRKEKSFVEKNKDVFIDETSAFEKKTALEEDPKVKQSSPLVDCSENAKSDEQSSFIETESLCMNCNLQGKTRILLYNIPFFKEVIVMSFECEKCGFKNNEVQMAQELQEKAIKYTLKVSKTEEMNRLIAINRKAKLYVPEIDLEIPSTTQALVTTVEGLFEGFILDLEQKSKQMKKLDQDCANLEEYILRLKKFLQCDGAVFPFHIILTDYSGNSFISQPDGMLHDNNLKIERFFRTKEQQEDLGYGVATTADNDYKETRALLPQKQIKMTNEEAHKLIQKMQDTKQNFSAHKLDYSRPLQEQESINDVVEIEADCYVCFKPGKFRTCQVEIPFFKEIIIMSFSCDHCGYKNTEVKTMGAIPDKGKKITLTVKNEADLNRDIFKSDSATVYIPQIDFEMLPGSLGSIYTTVEGLLEKIIENLKLDNPFIGDSSDKTQTKNFDDFLDKLLQIKEGRLLPFTLIMDDPLDSCFLLNPNYPDTDPQVEILEYERTEQQKEDLGINDMKV